jgi:hypothetical protein
LRRLRALRGQVDTPKLAAMGQIVMDLLRDAEVP